MVLRKTDYFLYRVIILVVLAGFYVSPQVSAQHLRIKKNIIAVALLQPGATNFLMVSSRLLLWADGFDVPEIGCCKQERDFYTNEIVKISLRAFGLNTISAPVNVKYISDAKGITGIYKLKFIAYSVTNVCSGYSFASVLSLPAIHRPTLYCQLFSFLLLIVLCITYIYYYFIRRTRIARQRMEDERRFAELQFRTLGNQLDPHFIFNALNAIGSSIYQNDREKSYDFLQRFSTLIRSTLVHADKTYRKLGEEIDFVKNYLELEKFRFENKFDYTLSVPAEISPDIPVPKMIIQTFAENAIKHGLVTKTGKGSMSISLSQENDYLTIIISDNGIGRSESLKLSTNSTGKGMDIMSEFITLFNRFNEKMIYFDVKEIVDSSGNVAGTHVEIKFPIDNTFNSITQTP